MSFINYFLFELMWLTPFLLLWLVLRVWLPWVWRTHIDNCRWLVAHSDDPSKVVRWSLHVHERVLRVCSPKEKDSDPRS